MTLTLQDRQRLAGICQHRKDWQAALTADGILKLDQAHPNDPLLVAALTIAAARNPAANGPAFMLGKDLNQPTTVTQRPAPRNDDPACTECGSQTRRPDGTCHGCYMNNLTERMRADQPTRPAPPIFRPAAPPPADFREQVAAITAARTSVASNVPTPNQKEQQ